MLPTHIELRLLLSICCVEIFGAFETTLTKLWFSAANVLKALDSSFDQRYIFGRDPAILGSFFAKPNSTGRSLEVVSAIYYGNNSGWNP